MDIRELKTTNVFSDVKKSKCFKWEDHFYMKLGQRDKENGCNAIDLETADLVIMPDDEPVTPVLLKVVLADYQEQD